jgi:nucleoside-diphosphate-sugar epimerase
VNEFAREVAEGKELIIFGEQFWRPYCHVNDLARSVILVLESETAKTAFEVFNVGDTTENYQKKMIADELLKLVPQAKMKFVQKTEDPRDYRVNFDKIENILGFRITKRVPDGLKEILGTIKNNFYLNLNDEKFKNIK